MNFGRKGGGIYHTSALPVRNTVANQRVLIDDFRLGFRLRLGLRFRLRLRGRLWVGRGGRSCGTYRLIPAAVAGRTAAITSTGSPAAGAIGSRTGTAGIRGRGRNPRF